MSTRKRLNFPSDSDGEDGDGDISVSDIVKHYSVLAEAEEEPKKTKKKNKKKKKKKKKKSKLIWSEDDELTVLKGLRDYGFKSPDFDWERFFSYAQGAVKANVSEKEMVSKIRKLKRNYLFHKKLIEQGNNPLFTRCSDSEAFGYASLFWSHDDDHELQTHKGGEENMNANEPLNENGAEQIEENRTVGEESREDCDNDELQIEKAEEQASNENAAENRESLHEDDDNETFLEDNSDEPVNGNGAEQTNKSRAVGEESREDDDDETFQEDTPVVNADELVSETGAETGAEQTTECRTVGEESGEDDADEFCGVRDALETVVLKGLSENQKEFHLEKMMRNIASGKRKELSDEWKELCTQEARFNAKKLRFRAKVEEAANGMKS